MGERVLVVGGNAAGLTAASRARRLRPDLEITILEMSHFISYSICGLPYYTFGLVQDHEQLIRFTPQSLAKERDIRARLRMRVDEIQLGRRAVVARNLDTDGEETIPFDRLVLCTGYRPRVPDIEGIGLDNVLTASHLEDGLRLRHQIETGRLRRAAIIGGGYVGLMMACGLRQRGMEVDLFEKRPHVCPHVDEEIATRLEEALTRQGIRLHLRSSVRRLRGESRVEAVETLDSVIPTDLVVVDIGVEPRAELARDAGIACGLSGAIRVDSRGQSEAAGVLAAGNCAETIHLVSGRPIASKLGTTAARQGRVVGETLAGVSGSFAGTLETSVEQLGDLGVGRTGLTLRQAHEAGFDAFKTVVTTRDRAAYLPDSARLDVALIAERGSGKLLGGQLIGAGQAPKRIDTLATALTAGMRLSDLAQLDLAYAPPYGTLWDPFQIAANVALRE